MRRFIGSAAACPQCDGQSAGAGAPYSTCWTPARTLTPDLVRAKGVNATYVGRIQRLTLLAPDIVAAILDGAAAGGAAAR